MHHMIVRNNPPVIEAHSACGVPKVLPEAELARYSELNTLKLALFYDLATETDGDLPTKPEKSERILIKLNLTRLR